MKIALSDLSSEGTGIQGDSSPAFRRQLSTLSASRLDPTPNQFKFTRKS